MPLAETDNIVNLKAFLSTGHQNVHDSAHVHHSEEPTVKGQVSLNFHQKELLRQILNIGVVG